MRTRSAFTLVELSIVLVILGLLVGGVLAGQSLIRSAELRAIITERDKLTTAFYSFKDKYMALPGDLANAYAFWQSAGVAGCATNAYDNVGGCNGDGDGWIHGGDSGVPIPSEITKVGMHLALAGLIEGTYDGLGEETSLTNLIGSKLNGGRWGIGHGDDVGPADAVSPGALYGGIYLSLYVPDDIYLTNITHGEAWTIDMKVDDGKANTGNMRGDAGVLFGWGPNGDCHDKDTDANAANGTEDFYAIAAVGADFAGDCTLHFILRK